MKARRRIAAFTLIEVVFALFLLATAGIIVTATLPIANVSRARSDMENKAVGLAQKELEAIRGVGYANASATQLYAYSLIDSTTSVNGAYSFTNVDTGSYDNPSRILPQGTGTVTIQQVDIDLRQVVVQVSWIDRGVARSYTLGTLIANL